MEHLTRNTHNDRIIYTLESIKQNNQSMVDKEISILIEKIINVFVGVFSSIISASVVGILKGEEKIPGGILGICLIFVVVLLGIWFLSAKWIVPFFYNITHKKHIDLSPQSKQIAVKNFNTYVLQKVAEVTETIAVIRSTNDNECKILNYIISLYKFQEIVDFLYDKFMVDKNQIRRSCDDGASELLRYSFNAYTVKIVVGLAKNIGREMESMLSNDEVILQMPGIELFEKDLCFVIGKLNKLEI